MLNQHFGTRRRRSRTGSEIIVARIIVSSDSSAEIISETISIENLFVKIRRKFSLKNILAEI
ncbi:MAG: hypothetical protein FJ218_01145 [Ignavibacteria bacterium]|nr:hypothetical protein [Ignavibacteria bacterium]